MKNKNHDDRIDQANLERARRIQNLRRSGACGIHGRPGNWDRGGKRRQAISASIREF